MQYQNQSNISDTILVAILPIEGEAVRPGDSIVTKFIRPRNPFLLHRK